MKYGRPGYEYTARLCPIDTFVDVVDREAGKEVERFNRFTFTGQLKDPTQVLVNLRHNEGEVVGALTKLWPTSTWWMARFVLDRNRNLSVVAEEFIEVGTPVSISFTPDPIHTRDSSGLLTGIADYQLAKLKSVAVLPNGHAAYEGAEVVSMERIHDPRAGVCEIRAARSAPDSQAEPKRIVRTYATRFTIR